MKRILKILVFALWVFASMQSNAQIISGKLQNNNGVLVPLAFYNAQYDSLFVLDTTDINGYYSTRVFDLYSGNIRCEFYNCDTVLIDTTFSVKISNTIWSPDYCSVFIPPVCNVSFKSNYCTCNDTFYLELDTIGLGNNSLLWNFGDGSVSDITFPYHVFNSNNLYDVCFTIIDDSTQSELCSFCRQIGYDNNGNVVTRNESNGFILKVQLPGTKIIDESIPSNSITIYPNPTGDFANVILYSDEENLYDIKIFNLIGQEIKSFKENALIGYNTYHFNLTELVSGNYFITVKSGGKRLTTVFAK